jgi:hypothetical protein
VEGEHNTFCRDEYDSFDNEMKKKYHEAMVQVVVEEIDRQMTFRRMVG